MGEVELSSKEQRQRAKLCEKRDALRVQKNSSERCLTEVAQICLRMDVMLNMERANRALGRSSTCLPPDSLCLGFQAETNPGETSAEVEGILYENYSYVLLLFSNNLDYISQYGCCL